MPTPLHCRDWADSILHGLQAQRADDSQCDVSLVSEDGYSIGAHSAVLCAASPKFKNLLERSQVLVVVKLKSIATETLQNVVDFIYSGKVDVGSGNVESIQQMAEGFEISGLVQACERTLTGRQGEQQGTQEKASQGIE